MNAQGQKAARAACTWTLPTRNTCQLFGTLKAGRGNLSEFLCHRRPLGAPKGLDLACSSYGGTSALCHFCFQTAFLYSACALNAHALCISFTGVTNKGTTRYLHQRINMLRRKDTFFWGYKFLTLRWRMKLNNPVSLPSQRCARITDSQQLLLSNMLLRTGNLFAKGYNKNSAEDN